MRKDRDIARMTMPLTTEANTATRRPRSSGLGIAAQVSGGKKKTVSAKKSNHSSDVAQRGVEKLLELKICLLVPTHLRRQAGSCSTVASRCERRSRSSRCRPAGIPPGTRRSRHYRPKRRCRFQRRRSPGAVAGRGRRTGLE